MIGCSGIATTSICLKPRLALAPARALSRPTSSFFRPSWLESSNNDYKMCLKYRSKTYCGEIRSFSHKAEGPPAFEDSENRPSPARACIGFLWMLTAFVGIANAPKAIASTHASHNTAETIALWQNPGPLAIVNYRIMQAFTLPTYGQLLAILAVGAPLVILGAYAYKRSSGAAWGISLLKTYYVLNRVPGTGIKDEKGKASLVLNLVHLVSVFSFAILIGVFTKDIASRVETMKAGNFPLPESGHTVLLGWNSRQSVIMLKQVLQAHSERGGQGLQPPIVILSENSKKAMDAVLVKEFGEMVGKSIMTRQGNPTQPLDLARAAAGRASAVVWMASDEESSKVDLATSLNATLASLSSIRSLDAEEQGVIICERGRNLSSWVPTLASRAIADDLKIRHSEVKALASFHDLPVMMSQTAMQPGLSRVFAEICQHSSEGAEFYTPYHPDLAGRSFFEARKSFSKGILCGVVHTDSGIARLNPPDNYLIQPGEAAVVLADDARQLVLSAPGSEVLSAASQLPNSTQSTTRHRKNERAERERQAEKHSRKPKQVVVISYDSNVGGLMEGLAQFAPKGSRVTFVVPKFTRQLKTKLKKSARAKNLKVQLIRGSPQSEALLLKAGVVEADSVLLQPLGPENGWHHADADNQMLTMLLQLKGILKDAAQRRTQEAGTTDPSHVAAPTLHEDQQPGHCLSQKPLNVVCCITSEYTAGVLDHLAGSGGPDYAGQHLCSADGTSFRPSARPMQVDKILSEKLVGGVLTQVASEPLLAGVFEDLWNEKGSEIYLRNPKVYELPVGRELLWEQIQDGARRDSEIAIGYIDAKGDPQLGLPSDHHVILGTRSKLVVLAEE